MLKCASLAVLRALLTFVTPNEFRAGRVIVHPSNRTLSERAMIACERTLTRHITRLVNLGLVARRHAPNGKRFSVRDASGSPALIFGLDLTPLLQRVAELRAAADAAAQNAAQARIARARLLNAIFEAETDGRISSAEADDLRKISRRKLSAAEFTAATKTIPLPSPATRIATDHLVDKTAVSDRQNDCRQDSEKDLNEEQVAKNSTQAGKWKPGMLRKAQKSLTVANVLEAVPNARCFAMKIPESPDDLHHLADSLAPSLGIDRETYGRAKEVLGVTGAVLAVLGLTEAYGRIRKPGAYLARLTWQARRGLDVQRMFRSLTGGALTVVN